MVGPHIIQISLVFLLCPFCVLGSHPGQHITFSCHVSFNSLSCDSVSEFLMLTVLRSIGQVLCTLSLHWDFFFFNLFYSFIYLFLAMLGLRFCARAFSSSGKRGPLFIAVRGPLTIAASLVAGHRLQMRRLSSCGSRA